jgi:hypothetical protein
MYFYAGQYPQLAGLTRSERRRTVAAAIRAHSPWTARRIVIAFVFVIVSCSVAGFFSPTTGMLSWSGTALALLEGIAFYGYMLWELNGPLEQAVIKYLAAHSAPIAA